MKIIADYLSWRDEYKRKRIPQKDYDYVTNFKKALMNSKKLKLDIPYFEFEESCLNKYNPIDLEKIIDVIQDEIYSLPIEKIAFNCFEISLKTQYVLKSKLKINSIVTLGSYSREGSKKFYESFSKLKYRINNPQYQTEKINLHAWLTLPNWMIIDVSILSSIKKCEPNSFSELDYDNFCYADSRQQHLCKQELYYHPILIGSNYLTKINIKPKHINLD